MKRARVAVCWLLILCSASCIDPLPLTSKDYRENIVIEGFLSSANESQLVSISRTSLINDQRFIPENGATVWIEDNDGTSISFSEQQPGRYQSITAGVPGKEYTLRVTLADNRAYTSPPVKLRQTPPIQEVNAEYRRQSDSNTGGIYFSVDSGDPTGSTRYYRWEFEETYEIKNPYPSAFEWLGGNNVQPRSLPIDHCWATDTSRNILVASSQALTEDVIVDFPIHFIPEISYAMRIRYSILVSQYSMTAESYSYWKLIRQINQSQGSLFDLQPGTIVGNMRNINDSKEAVLGYFDACTRTQKREFFTPENFKKDGYKTPPYLTSCQNLIPYEVSAGQIGEFMDATGTRNNLLISEATGSYDATLILRPRYCCDCTNQGTNLKPAYWP